MAAKIYYEKDVDIECLKDKVIGVIGYGAQGRAQALCARDAGLKVILGLRPEGRSYISAKEEGFEVYSIEEAINLADFIPFLIPDPAQPGVYQRFIQPNLKEGKVLCFAHGFNIHFSQIVPPDFIDVVMVAPKGPGSILRQLFKEKKGIPALVAVHQDKTGNALAYALAYAKSLGCTKAGVILTTFAEETETDLFGEQAVLCGGVSELIRAGFDTLVEAGYQPEVAFFECCQELRLIVELIYQHGISGMRRAISDTAKYGDITRGKRIIDEHVKNKMRELLKEIKEGIFAREWLMEDKLGRPVLTTLMRIEEEHLLEKIGKKLRAQYL